MRGSSRADLGLFRERKRSPMSGLEAEMLARQLRWLSAHGASADDLEPSRESRQWRAEYSLLTRMIRSQTMNQLPLAEQIDHGDIDKILGQHALAEFNTKDVRFTVNQLREAVVGAANMAGATILGVDFFETMRGGVTGVVVIAESHLIVHWLDDYLALDVYTCGQKIDPMLAVQFIKQNLGIEPYDTVCFKRGVLPNDSLKVQSGNQILPGIAALDKTSLRFYPSHRAAKIYCNSEATHYVVELYYSDPSIISHGESIAPCFSDAFGHEFRKQHIHEFPPKGIAGVSLVYIDDGIHVTTHPWPEVLGYVPLDVFVSKHYQLDARKAIERLAENLSRCWGPVTYSVQDFPRGVREAGMLKPVFNRIAPAIRDDDMLDVGARRYSSSSPR